MNEELKRDIEEALQKFLGKQITTKLKDEILNVLQSVLYKHYIILDQEVDVSSESFNVISEVKV